MDGDARSECLPDDSTAVRSSDDDRLRAEREMRSVDAIFMEKLLAAPVKDVEASLDCHGTTEDRPPTARNLDDAALQPVDLAVDDWPAETTRSMEKGRRLLAELSTIGETLSSESEIFKRLADLLADGSDTVGGNGPSEPVNVRSCTRLEHDEPPMEAAAAAAVDSSGDRRQVVVPGAGQCRDSELGTRSMELDDPCRSVDCSAAVDDDHGSAAVDDDGSAVDDDHGSAAMDDDGSAVDDDHGSAAVDDDDGSAVDADDGRDGSEQTPAAVDRRPPSEDAAAGSEQCESSSLSRPRSGDETDDDERRLTETIAEMYRCGGAAAAPSTRKRRRAPVNEVTSADTSKPSVLDALVSRILAEPTTVPSSSSSSSSSPSQDSMGFDDSQEDDFYSTTSDRDPPDTFLGSRPGSV